MSHFYGSIPVSARKTTATARGHKSTGLQVEAASWKGAIEVYLYHNPETDEDHYIIRQKPHHGAGVYENIAEGVLGE